MPGDLICDQCEKHIGEEQNVYFSDRERNLDFCSEKCRLEWKKDNTFRWKEIDEGFATLGPFPYPYPSFYRRAYQVSWEEAGFTFEEAKQWIAIGIKFRELSLVEYIKERNLTPAQINNLEDLRKEYEREVSELEEKLKEKEKKLFSTRKITRQIFFDLFNSVRDEEKKTENIDVAELERKNKQLWEIKQIIIDYGSWVYEKDERGEEIIVLREGRNIYYSDGREADFAGSLVGGVSFSSANERKALKKRVAELESQVKYLENRLKEVTSITININSSIEGNLLIANQIGDNANISHTTQITELTEQFNSHTLQQNPKPPSP